TWRPSPSTSATSTRPTSRETSAPSWAGRRRATPETQPPAFRPSSPLDARHLPRGDVDAVPCVDHGDREDEGREPLLVVVPGGLVPHLVRHRIRPVEIGRAHA